MIPNKTEEIITSETFLLRSTTHLSIEVSLYELSNERAYINICHSDSEGQMNYENCLLNKPLINGSVNEQLVLSNDTDNYRWKYGPTTWILNRTIINGKESRG